MGKRFTEGICGDGAAILDNGKQITITEILNNLNKLDELEQLRLQGVVPSYYQVVQGTRKLGLQEVTSGLKTLDEAEKAMKQNQQWFDKLYIIARIDN